MRRLVGTLGFVSPAVVLVPRAMGMRPPFSSSAKSPEMKWVCDPNSVFDFVLRESFPAGRASKVLRFDLPPHLPVLDRPAPSGVKVLFEGVDEKSGAPATLEKSYSPISLPWSAGHFDLLVKAYPPRPGGGVGSFLCGLQPGEHARMKVKAPRVIHGGEAVVGRWPRLGFVAGGTGVAPFLQIIRAVLADRADGGDATTQLRLLFVNRREEDILAREELDGLAALHPTRFQVTYCLTEPPVDGSWAGLVGRGSADMARTALSWGRGSDDETSLPGDMVMVCGTDGFVGSWAGPLERVKNVDGTKSKVQGPVLGFLKDAGYTESNVYKF